MLDFADFDARARRIGEYTGYSPAAVAEYFHAKITRFCHQWMPFDPKTPSDRERALVYEMLWRWELQRCEQALEIAPPDPEQSPTE